MSCSILPTAPVLQRLPANTVGKDYVMGDLHGCTDMLHTLRDHINFDPAIDRVFSVGDLIDRGPDSIGALKLLQHPWFYAIKGNHEALLLDYVWTDINGNEKIYRHDAFITNGGAWIESWISDAGIDPDLQPVLERVRALPFLMVVGDNSTRFHIAHAGLFRHYRGRSSLTDLEIDDTHHAVLAMEAWDLEPDRYPDLLFDMIWSRHLNHNAELPIPANSDEHLSLTFCGHNIREIPRMIHPYVQIDTGAYISHKHPEANYGLTIIESRSLIWHCCKHDGSVITGKL